MRATRFHQRLYGSIVTVLKRAVAGLLFLLLFTVVWGVITRFLFGDQSSWTEETAIYLLIWVSLAGAPLAYAENGHLGVDYFFNKWGPETQRLARLFSHLLTALFAGAGLLFGGLGLVLETAAAGQVSPATGTPTAIVYLAIPLSGAFFLFFALSFSLTAPEEASPPRPSR